jgi:ectoine hydroxylase-related dioxygenase (phytanoyl-CoA dioxygenase family)
LLPGAVPSEVCDRLRDEIEQAWSQGDERVLVLTPGSQQPQPLTRDTPKERMRAVDVYALFESAREALFNPDILAFLQVVFDQPPLLFQSLTFERGSQQGMHQDTAYVVVDKPLELAASWIALQNVEEGSGELMYYEGSHRLPEFAFSGQFKHWNRERDGAAQHDRWSREIHEHAQRLQMPYRTFLPKKGDVLIWHADLAHGGCSVVHDELTRKSLVGHYCPLERQPHYFSYQPDRRGLIPYSGGFYATSYYEI